MLNPRAPIVALVYGEGREVDPALRRLVGRLKDAGLRLAGYVQRDEPRPDRRRCAMALEDLAGGALVRISEDRGPAARGCMLDHGELMRALETARAALDDAPDLVVVNKFGKTEAEGGGFRPLIADALERGIPLLIAVPWRNIDNWRLFAGDLAIEAPLDGGATGEAAALAALGAAVRVDGAGVRSSSPREIKDPGAWPRSL